MLKRLFSRPTATKIAEEELRNAEQSLLEAQSAMEYAAAIVSYNQSRVARLRDFIKDSNAKTNETSLPGSTYTTTGF